MQFNGIFYNKKYKKQYENQQHYDRKNSSV